MKLASQFLSMTRNVQTALLQPRHLRHLNKQTLSQFARRPTSSHVRVSYWWLQIVINNWWFLTAWQKIEHFSERHLNFWMSIKCEISLGILNIIPVFQNGFHTFIGASVAALLGTSIVYASEAEKQTYKKICEWINAISLWLDYHKSVNSDQAAKPDTFFGSKMFTSISPKWICNWLGEEALFWTVWKCFKAASQFSRGPYPQHLSVKIFMKGIWSQYSCILLIYWLHSHYRQLCILFSAVDESEKVIKEADILYSQNQLDDLYEFLKRYEDVESGQICWRLARFVCPKNRQNLI